MFQLIQTPTSLPGSCVNCGSGLKPPYIDLGISVDFLGSIILCHECVEEAGHMLGMIDKDKHQENITDNIVLVANVAVLEQENKALRNVIDNANVANYGTEMMVVLESSGSHSGSISGNSDFTVDVVEDSEASRDSAELLDSGKRASDESSDDKRVDELRSDESESTDFKLRI